MKTVHKSVLLKEVIDCLDLKPGDNVVDCTLGGGGHSLAVLDKIGPEGKLLAIDEDREAIKRFELKVKDEKLKNKGRITLVNNNFRNLKNIINEQRFCYPISAILLDLGLSSDQLDVSGGGFTFQKEENLDMRFGGYTEKCGQRDQPRTKVRDTQISAQEIVNKWPQIELEKIFQVYGEDKQASKIAKSVVKARKRKPITTTSELVEIILQINNPHLGTRSQGGKYRVNARRADLREKPEKWLSRESGKIHPATKVFQALRIAVNDELETLRHVLPRATELLQDSGPHIRAGRIAVISFHGLEDRIVKMFFKDQARLGKVNILTKKPIVPSPTEIKENKRSRSAKLRVAEKINN